MTFAWAHFHIYLPWDDAWFSMVSFNRLLNVKALVGSFSVLVKYLRTFV